MCWLCWKANHEKTPSEDTQSISSLLHSDTLKGEFSVSPYMGTWGTQHWNVLLGVVQWHSKLCISHPHPLQRKRGKKADIEARGHSSAVCKKEKRVVAFLLSLCYCLFRNNTSPWGYYETGMFLQGQQAEQGQERKSVAVGCSHCIPTCIWKLWRHCVCLILLDFLDPCWPLHKALPWITIEHV